MRMENTSLFLSTETSDSLWDKLSIAIPSQGILRIFGGQLPTTIRFIGPFLPVSRKYIQQSPIWDSISPMELKQAIYDQDLKSMEEIKAKLQALPISVYTPFLDAMQSVGMPLGVPEALTFLASKWHQVLFVNVLIRKYNGKVLDCPLIRMFELATPFVTVLSNYPGIPINGIKAFDLEVSRTGEKLNSKWAITPSKQSTVLRKIEVETLLNDGLLDIKKILHEVSTESLNKKKGYLYRAFEGYKMPEEIALQFTRQIKDFEEDAHIDAVEAAVDDLPDSAFENKPDKPDAFSSIEIE